MKKIKYRSYFAYIIAIGVVFGVGIFLLRYFTSGDEWVMLRANQSVFYEGVLDTGTLTDRNGIVLAQAGDGVFSYAADAAIRESCFHAVGDYAGNIGTGALSIFNSKLAGYDIINGTTSLTGKGKTVRISIDSGLNSVAYQALAGRKGAVLVSNYKTGEVLCMVSSPSFDPNTSPDLTSKKYEGVFLNRSISSTYTPGSIYKIITLAAAIENIPNLDTMTLNCTGKAVVGGDAVTCTGVHGNQTIGEAFAHSCNSAFSELAQTLGPDKLEEYVKKYGLLDELDFEGIKTKAGLFEKADVGTANLSWSAIGQYTDLASPYAMQRIVAAVANGGLVEEPTLLKDGTTKKTRLMEETTANKIASMMTYNVTNAYGSAKFPNLNIGAKTGTAEVGDGTSNAWFVGFLNDEANPLAFTVIIESGGGGLANAGPIANKVLQAAVAG